MATSSIGHVRQVMYHVIVNGPKSVLDVGIGFGRWGFLCREMLDVFPGRVKKQEWKTRIEGIEVYEPYLQDHQRFIYDKIHIGNARDVIATLGHYDIVIIGDMLEHLSKDDAWALFHGAMERADMGLVLNLPIGKEWLRATGGENKWEDHLSWWTLDEFADYLPQTYLTRLENGMEHAAMFISSADYRYVQMLTQAGQAEQAGDSEEAVSLCKSAVSISPKRPEAYMTAADILLNSGLVGEAEKIMMAMTVNAPDYPHGRILLANLYNLSGKKDKATEQLQIVVSMPGVDEGIKTQAADLIAAIRKVSSA
ncbi:MAG: tetratricopeptide repeat protein [Nitrospinae bacterium]|nr:tetratricopeptide repeat protein [Nitrospinota bacterium]